MDNATGVLELLRAQRTLRDAYENTHDLDAMQTAIDAWSSCAPIARLTDHYNAHAHDTQWATSPTAQRAFTALDAFYLDGDGSTSEYMRLLDACVVATLEWWVTRI